MDIKLLFGILPDTGIYENSRSTLFHDYKKFTEFAQSEELKEFLKIQEEIESQEFKNKVNAIKAQKYQGSDEQRKELEFKGLKKSTAFKLYYKYLNGKQAWFEEYARSAALKNIEELEVSLASEDFKKSKSDLMAEGRNAYKQSPEHQKEKDYLALKKSSDYKKYLKISASKEFKAFQQLHESEKLTHFLDLEKYLQTEEFIKAKNYLLLKADAKYKQSEEYKKEQAYTELKNSDNIKWYFNVSKDNPFNEISRLELTFEDDFEAGKLDENKWMTRYFWGDALLKDSFSLDADNHYNTNGKNIEINNSVLSIVTKREEMQGKAWNPEHGFIVRNFSYTSGVLNTGHSFRQKYGIFEAKIKINSGQPVGHAFWLISDQMLPHIDVVKYDKKVWMNNFWLNGDKSVHKNLKKLKASKYTAKYFIYTLEWQKNLLVWKVNGKVIAKQTTGVPDEPMYINFSSGIFNSRNDAGNLPTTLDIDWVRCYQFND